MQIIKPLLGLSASPLGVTKFDTPNRFLLRKESNFHLGLKNCIQPLGAKSSLVNYSKLLLPRQDKTVHDENTWNIDWDFDALTKFSTPVLENQVETNDFFSQEEQAPDNDNNFIENFTTIITDLLPSTTLIDNSTINSTEDNYHNLTSISDINQEAIPNKKSENSSKKAKTKKNTAKTNKSSKNTHKIPKKSKTTVNTAPETNQFKLNDNLTDHDVLKTSPPTPLLKGEGGKSTPPSLLGNSPGGLGFPNNVESQNDNNFQLASLVEQNQLEAKNLSQDEHIATSPQVIVHDIENKSHVNGDIDSDIDSDININLKEISNQESILYPEVNTNFDDVQKIESSQETKNITKLNVQEKPVITQSVPKITLKPLEDSAFDNSDNSQDSISQNISEVIKQPIQEREEIKQQHTEQSSITSQPISIYREISSVEPTEIINTVDTSELTENFIHNIPLEQNINLELPITETVINNDVIDNITENQAPVIQDNIQANSYTQSDLNTSSLTSPLIKERQEFNDSQRQNEVITTNVTSYNINTQENNFEASQTISPVQNTDLSIQKFSQENYHVPANYSKNPDIENIATNLINSSEVISTNSNKELVPGANLDISDTTVIQKSIQHYNAGQTTDEIKSSLQLNNIPSVFTQNINSTVISTDIVDENNENLVTHEKTSNEQALPEISTSFVDNLETETLTNITDSKNILPILLERSSENLPDDLSSNLFNNLQNKLQTPTGYATGGLVAHSNISDNPTIAPSDTVPAMLTPGEFVINVRDAQKNINILRHINSGGTLPEDITTPVKPSIEQTEESGATEQLNSFQPSTNVDIQTSPINVISPKPISSEVRSPGINAPNPLQFNIFDNSTENSSQNSNQNLTTGVTNNSRQYSSPPLIFRQANTSNTTKVNEHNISTDIPFEWGSVEELLNGSANSTNNSTNENLEEFIFSKSAPSISTKRLPAVQGFAEGGEVTASDIATDIEPVTETIQRPADSNASDSSKEENENNSLDLETLAHQIYSRLRQRLEIERERYGAYSGRLPW